MYDPEKELLKLQNDVAAMTFKEMVDMFDTTISAIDQACLIAFADPEKLVVSLKLISDVCANGKELVKKLKEEES